MYNVMFLLMHAPTFLRSLSIAHIKHLLSIFSLMDCPCYVKRGGQYSYLFVTYRLMMADCAQLGRPLSGALKKIGRSG